MATSFNSQITPGKYRLQFETDDYDKFKQFEYVARQLIDCPLKPYYSKTESCFCCPRCDSQLVEGHDNCDCCGTQLSWK